MEKNNEAGNNNRRNIPPKKDGVNQYSINERIRAREVRLVGENVEQGVYSTHEALRIAEEQGLDLVEISPNAVPPVLESPCAFCSSKVTASSPSSLVTSSLNPCVAASRASCCTS